MAISVNGKFFGKIQQYCNIIASKRLKGIFGSMACQLMHWFYSQIHGHVSRDRYFWNLHWTVLNIAGKISEYPYTIPYLILTI